MSGPWLYVRASDGRVIDVIELDEASWGPAAMWGYLAWQEDRKGAGRPPCACGAPATHRAVERIPSGVGEARRYHRGCARCVENVAKRLLLEGAARVEVEVIGNG